MLHEIKIQMGINPKVLVADNGYMDDNIIKYAYDNDIRLIIPDRGYVKNFVGFNNLKTS